MSERIELIRTRLDAALQPSRLDIEDDSHRHAGHAGAKGGGGHYNVTVVSAAFIGKTPLQRHRLVYAALGELMQEAIHALSIRAYTPEEPLP